MPHAEISHKWSAFPMNMDGHEVQSKSENERSFRRKNRMNKVLGSKNAQNQLMNFF